MWILSSVLLVVAACAWPHPPRMDQATRIAAYLRESATQRDWYVKVCVQYRRGKPWCADLPGSYSDADAAWRAYRDWYQHVMNVVHTE